MNWAQGRRYALSAWRRFRAWPTRWQVVGWIVLLLLVGSVRDAFEGETTDEGGPAVVQPSLSVDDAAAEAEQEAADRRAARAEHRRVAEARRQRLIEVRKQRRARVARAARRERERQAAAALAAEQAPPPAPEPASDSGCDSNYSGCVPIASDVDCGGGSGDGPAYLDGSVSVIGSDVYGLDSDSDGTACE
jgi:hypothetical protein